MNKTIITAALMLAMTATAEVQRLTKDSTEADFRAVATQILACTNRQEAMQIWLQSKILVHLGNRTDLASLRAELDEAFAAKKIYHPYPNYSSQWPKTTKQAFDDKGTATNSPAAYALLLKYQTLNMAELMRKGVTLEEVLPLLSDLCAPQAYYTVRKIEFAAAIKKTIQTVATKSIRKILRRQGKSFVTKNGVNPCEQYLTALTAALNAPRFNGIDEWCESQGINFKLDTLRLPSTAEIETMKEQFLDGDKTPTEKDLYILNICLGTDAYNTFVREYNGD